MASTQKGRVRYAIVGLGYIAQIAVLPAFANAANNSELVAFVSDDQEKLSELKSRYNVEHSFSYDQYEQMLTGGFVDAVYIATPNSLHREFAVQAARAKINVLCEKPMAVNEADCFAMLDAAQENGIKFMVAYRLHFDEANMKIVELAHSGKIGDPRIFSSVFTMQVKSENVRTKKSLGGGPINDIGIYCINAARYLFRSEPAEVVAFAAKSDDERFREVDESVAVLMRFPGERIASFVCSFGASDVGRYELIGTNGSIVADPAYEYAEGLKFAATMNGKTEQFEYPRRDQFASQLVYFSDCIISGKEPEPSAEEGLADAAIITAIAKSIQTGTAVSTETVEKVKRPGPAEVQKHPPVAKPALVKVDSPHQ